MSTITELPSALPLITSSRQFLDSEQHIVDVLLANTDRAPQMTSAQLARASSTSEASVSRFCKKLGFKNYRSFQFSLARDLAAREGDERVTGEVTLDDIEQSLANIKHAKQREIEATLDALDPDTLRRVVDLFRRAGLVMFAAVGNTNAVAIDAAIKFGQLGIRCVANTITESSTSLALTMGKDDVLVLVSNSGKSSDSSASCARPNTEARPSSSSAETRTRPSRAWRTSCCAPSITKLFSRLSTSRSPKSRRR